MDACARCGAAVEDLAPCWACGSTLPAAAPRTPPARTDLLGPGGDGTAASRTSVLRSLSAACLLLPLSWWGLFLGAGFFLPVSWALHVTVALAGVSLGLAAGPTRRDGHRRRLTAAGALALANGVFLLLPLLWGVILFLAAPET